MVEQRPFKALAVGSSPTQPTFIFFLLLVRDLILRKAESARNTPNEPDFTLLTNRESPFLEGVNSPTGIGFSGNGSRGKKVSNRRNRSRTEGVNAIGESDLILPICSPRAAGLQLRCKSLSCPFFSRNRYNLTANCPSLPSIQPRSQMLHRGIIHSASGWDAGRETRARKVPPRHGRPYHPAQVGP
jgi:hypothetical protein